MKGVILTTDTKHHRYFANRLAQGSSTVVVLEQDPPNHPHQAEDEAFERLRDRYEDRFFEALPKDFSGQSNLFKVRSVNDAGCLKQIRTFNPDFLVTFGTGKVAEELFALPRLSMNVHRGILPNYRGLDSNLWAFYLGDFENIGTTLHRLTQRLDTGPILRQKKLGLTRDMRAHHIRFHTTVLATELVEEVLEELKTGHLPTGVPQDLSRSQYYSMIPKDKLTLADQRLQDHVATLN